MTRARRNSASSPTAAAAVEQSRASTQAAESTGSPRRRTRAERISAGFSLRIASANVCVFPLGTRNKSAPEQLVAGMLFAMAAVCWLCYSYAPWLPWSLWFPLAFAVAVPLQSVVIPLHALLLNLFLRGEWHDHKRARLRLLLRSLDSLDCVALQELYSTAIDSRYRDFVMREAAAAGFHYSVALPRVPRWPAMLLNGGTLMLSRYAITQQRSIVFKAKALFDLLIVNRGASWARIQLPTGHIVHTFTCHLAPPLKEIAERTTNKINTWLQDAQHQQLQELVQFIDECVTPDRKAWELECASAPQSPSSSKSPRSPRLRPFSVVVAGDFNVDAGCQRYFWLRHELHKLDLGLQDVFATEHSVEDMARAAAHTQQHAQREECDSEEEAAGVRECAEHCDAELPRQRRSARRPSASSRSPTAASSASSESASAPASPPVDVSSRMVSAPNRWSASHGNQREVFSPEEHSPFEAVMPPKGTALKWPATFGQVLRHPHSPEEDNSSGVASSGSSSPTLRSRHQEVFLTHPSLLGSHTTHDFVFSSLQARATTVQPFLAPHALRRMHVLEREDEAERNNVGAAASEWADEYDGLAGSSSRRRRQRSPPYSQLSDHCGLLATFMMPEEALQRSRANSIA